MKKKAFTLIEIIFVLIIIGIITTIAFPTYRNFIEDSRARVCETNLRALKTALDIYAMDHDAMPASLGQLPQEHIEKAYAQIMQQPDAWKIKLAYTILEFNEKGLAYAQEGPNLLYLLSKRNLQLITCPSAQTPPYPNGDFISNPSYVLNPIIAGITSLAFRNLALDTPLIYDTVPCHKQFKPFPYPVTYYSIGITRGGTIKRD